MREEGGLVKMWGVREYAENYDVFLRHLTEEDADFARRLGDLPEEPGREVIVAYNEGGFNCTEVDLLDLIDWLKANRPELLK